MHIIKNSLNDVVSYVLIPYSGWSQDLTRNPIPQPSQIHWNAELKTPLVTAMEYVVEYVCTCVCACGVCVCVCVCVCHAYIHTRVHNIYCVGSIDVTEMITIWQVSFKGGNFRGFRGFCFIHEIYTTKILTSFTRWY